MSSNYILLYLAIIIFALFILGYASWAKAHVDKKKKLISLDNYYSYNTEEKKDDKEQKPIDVESLLVQNNPIIKFFYDLDKDIKVKFLAIIGVSVASYYLSGAESIKDFFIPLIVIVIAFIIFPSFIANILIKGKIKQIMIDMPGFIDLVAVNLQVGISLEGAMKNVAQDFEMLNKDLTELMNRVLKKSEVVGLETALLELSASLPTSEIKMFCTVLLQSLNFGSSIYQHLIQLSADIRELQLLEIEEKIGSLAAKMSVPLIVFIMFPIVILIIAPGAMRILPTLFQ